MMRGVQTTLKRRSISAASLESTAAAAAAVTAECRPSGTAVSAAWDKFLYTASSVTFN